MSRARVTALALVNWKGVFYERYLLDRHVTALEGANGAGKTTVMIAAYVVLLPDMTRLRFTNLGESGATGGDRGIWGRLGEPGRPAYGVLELQLEQQRLLLGVCLTRTSEPTVEPTAFIVSGLSEGVRLSDVLLLRREDGDHVPELAELKSGVARAGGSIQVFRTTKEYFAALYERGITPLRLTGELERNKWNDMLRTSMTGGISRALGSELRSFLLREESGLSDTLSRMRDNLESCRRTRVEVLESRHLEREISAIYEAGLAMFAAALHAVRAAGIEARARVREAAEAIERAVQQQTELTQEASRLALKESELAQRSEQMRAETLQLEAAKQRRVAAVQLSARLAALDAELRVAEQQLESAQSRQMRAAAEREAAKQARARALEDYDRASVGLSSLQKGLEELARRAHAYKELQRCIDEARGLLERPTLQLSEAVAALDELAQLREQCEVERAGLVRQGRDLDARRQEHANALQALDALAGCELLEQVERRAEAVGGEEGNAQNAAGAVATEPGSAGGSAEEKHESSVVSESLRSASDRADSVAPHERARALLACYAQLEAGTTQITQLDEELRRVRRKAARQQSARTLALQLELISDAFDEPNLVSDRLTDVEREQQALEPLLHPDAAALTARQELQGLRAQHAAFDQRAACYRLAAEAAQRLDQGGTMAACNSQAELLALRDRLVAEQLALAARREAIETQRESLHVQAAELNRGSAVYAAELLRVRDELGAELLAARFEDLDPEQARWIEARLGPWVDALVVDDLEAAAAALSELSYSLSCVHLVRAGHSLAIDPPEAVSGDVLVTQEPLGARVTKLPAPPNLGKRAREVKLHELRSSISAHTVALEQIAAEVQHNAAQRRDADVLWTHAEVWLAGDPTAQKQSLEAEIGGLEAREREQQQKQQAARTRLLAVRERAEGLRRLLPDAELLGPPEHALRARELEAELGRVKQARRQLSQLSAARSSLSRLIDVLRSPPPDDDVLAQQGARLAQLDVQLDRMFRARSALEGVLALQHARDFGDAQVALDAQAQLSPALEHQQKHARAQLQSADEAQNAALSAWEDATLALQTAQAAKAALLAQRERAAAELYELGGPSSEQDAQDAEQQLVAAQAEQQRLADASRQAVAERALAHERRSRAEGEVIAMRARKSTYDAEAQPLEQAWSELREATESAGLLHTALSMAPGQSASSLQLRAEAESKRELLVDRVARVRGADELLSILRGPVNYLESWQAVRVWLGRRVPAQIAEVADPLVALTRLRDHLDVLEARLARQEGDLRGSSEDVARGIDVQLRRAQGQVRRLNQQLDGIGFGSIHGIRIEIRRIERMEQVLRALREGQAQELLFSSSLPIEEALDEIFKRYGGGGKSGGQRLLDYREYVELAVEIRRQAAAAWEPANPTRLSTGEAIGVGAALMMVVLTEWERDASLLGPKNAQGSLRFLFLDEANRLSRDNLGVLFDLCRSLDLQLLVAAPEVARADGNTTYRLVRHTGPDGREEVIVSGRRSVSTEADPAEAPELSEEGQVAAQGASEAQVAQHADDTTTAPSPGLFDFEAEG